VLSQGAALTLSLGLASPSRAAEAGVSELAELFSASTLGWPGPSFAYQKTLEYPSWLFGEWDASSRLTAFVAPKGDAFVPPAATAAAAADQKAGDVRFCCRFYSTLPDSRSNALRVALGSLPESAVVADRAFNVKSLTEATLARPGAVASVEYDPREAPDRLTVLYAPPAQSKAELYLSAFRSDDTHSGSGAFHTAECIRQVTLGGVGRETVNDYQIVCRFEQDQQDANRVLLRQKVAVYLSPYDPLYFSAVNQAVGIYSYDIQLQRVITASPEAGGAPLTCVETPKDVVQCI
jgi:hypothetical protein